MLGLSGARLEADDAVIVGAAPDGAVLSDGETVCAGHDAVAQGPVTALGEDLMEPVVDGEQEHPPRCGIREGLGERLAFGAALVTDGAVRADDRQPSVECQPKLSAGIFADREGFAVQRDGADQRGPAARKVVLPDGFAVGGDAVQLAGGIDDQPAGTDRFRTRPQDPARVGIHAGDAVCDPHPQETFPIEGQMADPALQEGVFAGGVVHV